MHNGRLRMNGEKYDGGSCTECECRGGLTRCQRTQCPETLECGWATTPKGECCPVCQGITSTWLYCTYSGTMTEVIYGCC